MNYTRGLKDGLPIALGYVPVAFAYAIRAVSLGFPAWFPILISASNFTGTGQVAGTDLIAEGANMGLLFATMLIINIRYSLMSVSIAQKLEPNFPVWKRAIVSFGVTDENYAVAVRQPHKLTFPYLYVYLFLRLAGRDRPGRGAQHPARQAARRRDGARSFYSMIMDAFSISLYAMFIAIIVPPSRDDRHILLLLAATIALSCLFYFLPVLKDLPSGVNIIVCSIVCTVIVSLLFPRTEKDDAAEERAQDGGAQ